MNYIFDASCLFNLAHGEVFDTILELEVLSAQVGPIVVSECASIKSVVDTAISAGQIELLDDSAVNADLFISLLDTYNLGPGETECIAFAKSTTAMICMDDGKARKAATHEIGADRVTGSLGLLRIATEAEQISVEDAFGAYSKMIAEGAFLPVFSKNTFVSDVLEK